MEVYQELFGKWADVQKEYSTDMPEPDEVLLAYYSYEDYSGTSLVLFRKGDKYYMNNGGHCSCNGLEDQWGPEEYPDKDTFIKMLENHYKNSDTDSQIAQVLKKLKRVQ